MPRAIFAAMSVALLFFASTAQDAVGTLTVAVAGEERPFVVIQGGDGPNPGSRYSMLGGDVVMNLVAVSGDRPLPPDEASETVELRFTVAEGGPEVRTGSVLSYSTRDADGAPATRGATVEIQLDSLVTESDGVSASGTFVAQLPPDQTSDATEVEGTFRTAMKSREAVRP